jgi:hypothetical protein
MLETRPRVVPQLEEQQGQKKKKCGGRIRRRKKISHSEKMVVKMEFLERGWLAFLQSVHKVLGTFGVEHVLNNALIWACAHDSLCE